MKQLPNSELEIIMIIWEYNRPVTRMEIEEKLEKSQTGSRRCNCNCDDGATKGNERFE